MIRSFLFVPGDSERKIEKSRESAADAIILDLEDAVLESARAGARELCAATLAERDNIWVRINPLDSEDADLDLEAVMPSSPDGIVLPKPESAADAVELAARLDELEEQHGLEVGSTKILPLCTERPEALFSLGGYVGATARLYGLSWGAEDLAAAVGATTNKDENGEWLPPYEMARSMCLFAAASAGVAAIDTIFAEFRDLEGLKQAANHARRDGFSGMLAIHPAQVEIINASFTPTANELAHAEEILSLFADNPDAGALSLDGKMIDRPHVVQAERIVALHNRLTSKN